MPRSLSICLINPRNRPSYWTGDYIIPFYRLDGKRRYWMANGALLAVAALVPEGHEVVLLDENVDTIDFEALRRFDVIGVTGMVVQSQRMVEILRRLRELPAVIAVGGPLVTVHEPMFEGLCDVRFIGEAEDTWPAFLNALAAGAPTETRYTQPEKSDMTRVPVPRFDLLKRGAYAIAPIQFSRGCPFMCEFCDIITIFGRRPRLKTADQVLAELDALVAHGFRACFLVDDNFIGNKVEAKRLLRRIIEWQEARGFPLTFMTEASINLADDAELLELMVQARLNDVFVGIETPRRESLVETKKVQNVHGDSLLAKIQRIRAAGIIVSAGFIVGFDHDDERIFDEQFEFIQASGIAHLSISMLTPLPTTPLYDRLLAEGRLDFSDPELIFIPKQMTREQLKTGFVQLLHRIFDVRAYFDRVFESAAGQGQSAAAPRVRRGVRAAAYRLLRFGAGAARAVALGAVMAKKRTLWRHLREVPYVVGRNLRAHRRIGFTDLVNHWIGYWHFASVTRELSATDFGTITAVPPQP